MKTIMEQLADFTGDDYGKLVTSLLVVLDYSKCSEEQIKELKELLEKQWSDNN